MRTFHTLLTGILTLAAASCSTTGSKTTIRPDAKLEPAQIGSVERVHAFDRVFIGSQPSAQDLKAASDRGIRTIINLRPASEIQFDEAAAAAALGIHYVNIPVTPATLTDKDVNTFIHALSDSGPAPVFVHCASGGRAGLLWTMYRHRQNGLAIDAAIAEGKTVGMKTPALEQWARDHASAKK